MSEPTPRFDNTVPVRMVGGPDDWHNQLIEGFYTGTDLAGPREDLEVFLPTDHGPQGHPDPDALAVYRPDGEPARPDVWFFRGWMPDWPGSPEHRRPQAVRDLAVDVDNDGLPTALTDPTRPADRVRVVRVLAHWDRTTETGDALDIWHVLTRDGDHHLEHRLGEGWVGGVLPPLSPGQHDFLA